MHCADSRTRLAGEPAGRLEHSDGQRVPEECWIELYRFLVLWCFFVERIRPPLLLALSMGFRCRRRTPGYGTAHRSSAKAGTRAGRRFGS